MQLIAQKKEGGSILASDAKREESYVCPTCGGPLRLRGGHHRQCHFYHTRGASCDHTGKGMAHLQAQLRLYRLLPKGEALLEHPFPSIGRIGDLYWPNRSIVFEIQYSPISAKEVEARERDYASLGLHLVWILSDQRFNRKRCSAGEVEMVAKNHYFATIDSKGRGLFYDQWGRVESGMRTLRLPRRPVDLSLPSLTSEEGRTLSFEGDRLSLPPEMRPPLPLPTPQKQSAKNSLYRSLIASLLESLGAI